jgi:hypothetical protein
MTHHLEPDDPQALLEQQREMLQAIVTTHMPFGRYGPRHFPPRGLPLDELPLAYLSALRRRGFSRNRLGQLLEFTWQIKSAGSGDVLQNIKKNLRKPAQAEPTPRGDSPILAKRRARRRREWKFPENE